MASSYLTSTTLWTVLCLCIAFATAQTPANQCFWKANQQVVAEGDGWYACNNTATTPNGASLCCMKGSQCGEDSLCHYPSGSNGGSGWYLGGCTDGSYNDPVCPRACTGHKETWIQYNDTEQLWRCCGDDICNGTPSSETFQAVAPDQWSALPSQATSTASPSKTATSTSTTTGTGAQNTGGGNNQGKADGQNNDSSNSGGLSTGAQAGIGVGVGIAGLAIIAAIAFYCLRRRKRSNVIKSDSEAEQMTQNQGYGYAAVPAYPGTPSNQSRSTDHKLRMPLELSPEQRVELGAGMQSPQELAAVSDTTAELDANGRR